MKYINDYPLGKRYRACEDYFNHIDWTTIFSVIGKDGIAWFDVSSAVDIFPHLTLDKNYRLCCCMAREYHGYWGRVAAMPVNDPEEPLRNDGIMGCFFDLPSNAAPPMEAIFRTNHDHGYMDAALCQQLLSKLPYNGNPLFGMEEVICSAPLDYESRWDVYINNEDWRARILPYARGFDSLLDERLISFHRTTELGIGSSDGLDRLYLDEYHFFSSASIAQACSKERRYDSMYTGYIDGKERYSPDRRCCAFESTSIEIARQKFSRERFPFA